MNEQLVTVKILESIKEALLDAIDVPVQLKVVCPPSKREVIVIDDCVTGAVHVEGLFKDCANLIAFVTCERAVSPCCFTISNESDFLLVRSEINKTEVTIVPTINIIATAINNSIKLKPRICFIVILD